MLRVVPSVALAKTSSRSSVKSEVDRRSAPYASSRPTGTTSKAAAEPAAGARLSTNSFSSSGTPTLAILAEMRKVSAMPTRQR